MTATDATAAGAADDLALRAALPATAAMPLPGSAEEEAARLEACTTEPIHRPGAVQPHGVLLVLDDDGVVLQASRSTTLLGHAPEDVVGQPLSRVLGELEAAAVLRALAPGRGDAGPLLVEVGGRPYDAITHRSVEGLGILELEPTADVVAATGERWLPALHASIQRISRTTTVEELRREAAQAVRRLTGFDRVMVYHFHPDGHGEVVAEDRAEHLEPYLGLHYPASDIPPQARRLYLLRLSRTIPSRDYVPAPLVPELNPRTGAPTDLSLSELRSVSPHHLGFLRNMGVGATLSISLVHDGRLIGMISCNNTEPRHVPYGLRRGCEILGQQVALQVRALSETRHLERRLELQGVRATLVEHLGRTDDGAAALTVGDATLLDVVHADGALVRVDGRTAAMGTTPPPEQVAAAAALLRATPGATVATAGLPADHPELAALLPGVTGMVLVPLGDADGYLAWFRPAIAQTVEWLGDQTPDNRVTPLSPRNSFHRWKQTVTDRALAWDEVEVLEALALRDMLVRHVAQLRARRAAVRAALTARVTSQLAETLDAEEAVARLARLVVPDLADWCIVSLVDDDHPGGRRSLRDIGWWHADPEVLPMVERYATLRQKAVRSGSFIGQALETGRTVVVPSGASGAASAVLAPGEARELLIQLAPEAGVVLPLRARNRTVGLITLYSAPGRGPITPDELSTAEEVAGRAGLALDNARLYREQLLLAEGLQRSLLSDPPHSDHLQIAVRYTPAAEAARVGGDWYDAFIHPSGETTLVIGDVVGHDVIAAAAMGQLRSLVRGIAVTTDGGPADVLTRVDGAVATLRAETIATGVVMRVDPPTPPAQGPTADGGAGPAAVRLRWSNAGHPPPMLLAADGTAGPMTAERTDLILGVVARTERHETQAVLEPGATVLLYTDGLVERRGERLQDGFDRLRGVLADLAGRDLGDLCDEVLERMLPERPDDDVALVAFRLR